MFKPTPELNEATKKEEEKAPGPKAREATPWPLHVPLGNSDRLSCILPEGLKVVLTQEAFEQLFGYAYATRNEISCLGVVRRQGNSFIIEKFHLVKQEGGTAHTEMEPSAVAEMMEQLLQQGKIEEARSVKCWAHSHPGMGVFWSNTDDATCLLLASDYLVSLVVSDDYTIRCRIDTRQPIPFTVDQVPVFCEVRANQAKLEQYAREVAEKVKVFAGPVANAADAGRRPSLFDDDESLWSDYFRQTHGFLEDDETVELEPVREDPQIPF